MGGARAHGRTAAPRLADKNDAYRRSVARPGGGHVRTEFGRHYPCPVVLDVVAGGARACHFGVGDERSFLGDPVGGINNPQTVTGSQLLLLLLLPRWTRS